MCASAALDSSRMGPLLQQILDNPTDDQLRAVYADELQANGDPRGELIAIDLELARSRTSELVARRAALLAEHAQRWWPAIPIERLEIRRGFVERVVGTRAELVAATPMFETEPIERAELVSPTNYFQREAWQRRIRQLAIRSYFDGVALRSLTFSTLDHQLEALDLADADMSELPALGDHLSRCRSLSLAGNLRLRAHLIELHSWNHWPALELLDVRRCGIDALMVNPLVEGLDALRVLKLSGNPIGSDGASSLAARLAQLPALRELHVLGCDLGADAARTLTDTLPGVRIELDMPRRVPLDLVGHELVFVHDEGATWRIEVDGVARPIAVTHAMHGPYDPFEDSVPPHITPVESGFVAELEPLVRAVAEGATRLFLEQSNTVTIDFRSPHATAATTPVWTSSSAHITITPLAIEIELQQYPR
ncbi:MAG TPA: TIGR02996 domain-containing protein [Kofleriaceae bacterium]|nr:TIGR02996 domain-containing protein [Kofleriaceae bacterium]